MVDTSREPQNCPVNRVQPLQKLDISEKITYKVTSLAFLVVKVGSIEWQIF